MDSFVIKPGLRTTTEDKRDFVHEAVFGSIKLSDLPKEYIVGEPLEIKDQKDLDFCGTYASAAVSEDQDGIILDPHWAFAKTKELMGSYDDWGADLRSICKSAVTFGFLPEDKSPLPDALSQSRDFMANWGNWPKDLEKVALPYKKKTFFRVDSRRYDRFDALRTTLWQNRNQKRSILTGATWRQSWTNAQRGTIPTSYEASGFGHAFKIFGFDGEWLIAQLSNGIHIGDKGIFQFPREVVNKEFTYGAFTFKDLTRSEAEYYARNGVSISDSWPVAMWKSFVNFFRL